MTAYYIDQNGSDSNNGTGPGTAWRCLGRAFDELGDGDTLAIADDTWTLEHKATYVGTGDFDTGTHRFSVAGATFESDGIVNGDYLWATDPDGTYRSFKINGVVNDITLGLLEDATATAAAGAAGCWVTSSTKMPEVMLTCAATASNAETEIKITFNGTVIDGDGLSSAAAILKLNDCDNVWILGDLTIRNSGGGTHGIYLYSSGANNSNSILIEGVTIHDCFNGIDIDLRVYLATVAKCHIYDNRNRGIDAGSIYGLRILNCRLNGNKSGLVFSYCNPAYIDGCLIYDNIEHGIWFGTSGNATFIINNNIIYGNGKQGLILDTDFVTGQFRTNVLVNNIIWGNNTSDGGYLDIYTPSTETCIGLQRNNYFKTKSAAINVDDTDIQTATAPGFVNAAGGDFRLKAASPCVAAGFTNPFIANDEKNIGPHQPRLMLPKARPAAYANPLGVL